MNVEEINNIEDSDKYWEEANKYVLERFTSIEGQEKLKGFKDTQKELVLAVKNNMENFSRSLDELKTYISKELKCADDIFEAEGIDPDKIYDDEALTLYLSLVDFKHQNQESEGY